MRRRIDRIGLVQRWRATGLGSLLALAVTVLAVLGTTHAYALGPWSIVHASRTGSGGWSGGDAWAGSTSSFGTVVAFSSASGTFVAGDANGVSDVFIRTAASTTRVAPSGVDTNGESLAPSVDAAGSKVVYQSLATNLGVNDTNGSWDVYSYDRASRTVSCVSRTAAGATGNGASRSPAISADGRYVAFVSSATDLLPGASAFEGVYVRDTTTGALERVSVATDGAAANGGSGSPAISADGRYVAFDSSASNLVADDTNSSWDVFVHDRVAGTTRRVSIASDQRQAWGDSRNPAVSKTGKVAFMSQATTLVAGDTNGAWDIFVRDTTQGTTRRVSCSGSGIQGNSDSRDPAITADGSLVVFSSLASNLVAGDSNAASDVFETGPSGGSITRISVTAAGAQGNGGSSGAAIDAAGSAVVFGSDASNIVTGDTNGANDVFVATFGRVYRRFAGANRYRVAVSISQHSFPTGAPAVVIATGENWPDALGGSALAGTVGGPLLLTTSASLPSNVQAEIVRLGAKKAYVLGGAGSVGPAVEARLKSLLGSGNVTRLGGSNRYQVATAVGAKVVSLQSGAYDGTALVATGGNYPDALAGSPIAAATGRPIVLANPATGAFTLPPGTKKAVIFGGPGSVSPGVEAALKARLGTANVMRLGGADRYAAAAGIAQWGVDSCGLAWDDLAIATGEKFPDALSGGVMAGRKGSVVMLTRATVLPSATSAKLSANKVSIHQVNVCGGTGSVSDSVMTGIKKALGE